MIKAVFYKNSDFYMGFSVSGHAGYAKKGMDIVCSSVSVLVINTVNAIEKYTDNDIKTEIDPSGSIKFKFTSEPDEKGKLLVDTLVLGMLSIHDEYGDKYLELYFKEV